MLHHTGIPHSPTGQAIVERAHGTLKHILEKQKGGMCGESPQSRVAKALYTLNHLTILTNSPNPVILNHFLSLQSSIDVQSPKPKVLVWDLITNKWEGPWEWHGYACISTDDGIPWVPAPCMHPALYFALDHNQQHLPDSRTADAVEQ